MEKDKYSIKRSKGDYLLFYRNGKRIARDRIPERVVNKLLAEEKKPMTKEKKASPPRPARKPPVERELPATLPPRPVRKPSPPVERKPSVPPRQRPSPPPPVEQKPPAPPRQRPAPPPPVEQKPPAPVERKPPMPSAPAHPRERAREKSIYSPPLGTPPFKMARAQRLHKNPIDTDVFVVVITIPFRSPKVLASPSEQKILASVRATARQLRLNDAEIDSMTSALQRRGRYYWRFGRSRFYLFFFANGESTGVLYNPGGETRKVPKVDKSYELFIPIVLVPNYAPELRLNSSLLAATVGIQAIGARLGLDNDEVDELGRGVDRVGYYHRSFGNIWFYLYYIADSSRDTVARRY